MLPALIASLALASDPTLPARTERWVLCGRAQDLERMPIAGRYRAAVGQVAPDSKLVLTFDVQGDLIGALAATSGSQSPTWSGAPADTRWPTLGPLDLNLPGCWFGQSDGGLWHLNPEARRTEAWVRRQPRILDWSGVRTASTSPRSRWRPEQLTRNNLHEPWPGAEPGWAQATAGRRWARWSPSDQPQQLLEEACQEHDLCEEVGQGLWYKPERNIAGPIPGEGSWMVITPTGLAWASDRALAQDLRRGRGEPWWTDEDDPTRPGLLTWDRTTGAHRWRISRGEAGIYSLVEDAPLETPPGWDPPSPGWEALAVALPAVAPPQSALCDEGDAQADIGGRAMPEFRAAAAQRDWLREKPGVRARKVAREAWTAALASRRALVAQDPAAAPLLLVALDGMAEVELIDEAISPALALAEEAVALARRLVDEAAPDGRPQALVSLRRALSRRAEVRAADGDLLAELDDALRVLDVTRELAGLIPEGPLWLGRYLRHLARTADRAGARDRAADALAEASGLPEEPQAP